MHASLISTPILNILYLNRENDDGFTAAEVREHVVGLSDSHISARVEDFARALERLCRDDLATSVGGRASAATRYKIKLLGVNEAERSLRIAERQLIAHKATRAKR